MWAEVEAAPLPDFRLNKRLQTIVERLSDWASDELIYLDISRREGHDLGRDDLHGATTSDILSILTEVARRCFMPLAFGGGIRTIADCEERIRRGADKIVINGHTLAAPVLRPAIALATG